MRICDFARNAKYKIFIDLRVRAVSLSPLAGAHFMCDRLFVCQRGSWFVKHPCWKRQHVDNASTRARLFA